MQNEPDIEALKAELADKKAMLADLQAGKFPSGLGRPFENRELGIQRRIDEIESLIRGLNAARP